MSSTKSSPLQGVTNNANSWTEVGLVLVDIANHSEFLAGGCGQDIEPIEEAVKNSCYLLAEAYGGKQFCWEATGGAFIFPIESDDSFDNFCRVAIEMLNTIQSIDVESAKSFDCRMDVRVACDSGMVASDPESSRVPGDFVERLTNAKGQAGSRGRVTITERVHRRLTAELKSEFVLSKNCPELGAALYCSQPSPVQAAPGNSAKTSPSSADVAAQPHNCDAGVKLLERTSSLGERVRVLYHRARQRPATAVALLIAAMVGIIVGRTILAVSAPVASATTGWAEPASSAEWMAWRRLVHERLSTAPVTEKSLIEALQDKPSSVLQAPAAMLRRDQAIAEVLLSYPGVASVLDKRLGINEQFLGTGFSEPVNETEYWSAADHEYLIDNYPDNHPQVWAHKWRISELDDELMSVRELVAETPEGDNAKGELKQRIIARAETKETGRVPSIVIRFGRFDEWRYSRMLGRPERARVFASALAPYWNMKLKDAAERSGYRLDEKEKGGDTFFIFIFVPHDRREVTPATWGEVFKHLPIWLAERES